MDLIESTGYERLPEVCHIDIDREDFEVGLLALLRIISIIGMKYVLTEMSLNYCSSEWSPGSEEIPTINGGGAY